MQRYSGLLRQAAGRATRQSPEKARTEQTLAPTALACRPTIEPGGPGSSHRPHLVIAAAIRKDVEDHALRAEYLIALWLLICVVVAIDRRTIKAGRVGLVLDGAIALPATKLTELGFKRGRKRAGYRGEYYTLAA
jgi:hypothetical protein